MDEALVNGESLLVEKKPGDQVIAGSINGAGAVHFKATGVGEDTTLARIAKLVETAQNSKAPGQRLADKAAAYLVVLAASAGMLTFAAWPKPAAKDDLKSLPMPEVEKKLESSLDGLSQDEAARRLAQYGENSIPAEKPHPLLAFPGKFWGRSPGCWKRRLFWNWSCTSGWRRLSSVVCCCSTPSSA